MRKTTYLICGLLALLLGSGVAMAMNLNEAMSALPAAKTAAGSAPDSSWARPWPQPMACRHERPPVGAQL